MFIYTAGDLIGLCVVFLFLAMMSMMSIYWVLVVAVALYEYLSRNIKGRIEGDVS